MARTDIQVLLKRCTQTLTLLATLVCARTASADPLTVMWDLNSEPEVIGYLVYIGTQPGIYMQSADARNTNSYVFTNAVPGQRYYFVVVAYTGQLMSAPSDEVSAVAGGSANQPPSLVNPGNQSGRVGQTTLLRLSGSDPEGGALSFSASGLPTGLSVSSSSGVIAGVPTTPGTYSVTARVSDGLLVSQRTFTWVIASSTTSLGGSEEPTIDRSLARHASSASSYTGTVAVARTVDVPSTLPTIVRAPDRVSQAIGTVSGVPVANYSGSTAVTRTVAHEHTEETTARAYTGRTAVPRPASDVATTVDRSGLTTRSMVRNPEDADAADAEATNVDATMLSTQPRRTAVSAPSAAPTVSIETPVAQAAFSAGSTVIFSAIAQDVEDGSLTEKIVWTSSVDGSLGTGGLINKTLSSGSHTITASVTDSKGNTRSAQVSVVVQ